MTTTYVLVAAGGLGLLWLASDIRVIRQYERGIVLRFGRRNWRTRHRSWPNTLRRCSQPAAGNCRRGCRGEEFSWNGRRRPTQSAQTNPSPTRRRSRRNWMGQSSGRPRLAAAR